MAVCAASSSGLRALRAQSRSHVISFTRRSQYEIPSSVTSIAKDSTTISGLFRAHRPTLHSQQRCLPIAVNLSPKAESASSIVPAVNRQDSRRYLPAVAGSRSFRRPLRFFSSTTSRCLPTDEQSRKAATNTSPSISPTKPVISILKPTVHENIYNIPNFLTFTRLLAGPGLAYLIVTSSHTAALSLFVYAGITDALDGYLARRWKQTSVVGSVIDPMADKTLMTAATLALAAQARMPWPLAIIILGRDVLLAISAIYYRWISLPPPKTMTRYWDFSLPSAEVRPTTISKLNTVLQLVLIGATVTMPLVPESVTAAWKLWEGLVALQWTVGATTIWSGLSYVGSKDAVRILGKDSGSNPK